MRPEPGSRRRVEVTTVTGGALEQREDVLAVEEPLQIRLATAEQTRDLAITMRTPGDDHVLALGHLFSEGLIEDRRDVLDVRHCLERTDGERQPQHRNVVTVLLSGAMPVLGEQQRYGTMTSACGVCGRTTLDALDQRGFEPLLDGPFIDPTLLGVLPERLRSAQHIFEMTGGLHAAARFDDQGQLLDLREDVGRHNALDKLIGASLRAGTLPWTGQVLLLSGRASYELVQKAVAAGVGFVAAIGAPSSLAVDVAAHFGVTLAGFLRRDRVNVYTHPRRLAVREGTPTVGGQA